MDIFELLFLFLSFYNMPEKIISYSAWRNMGLELLLGYTLSPVVLASLMST